MMNREEEKTAWPLSWPDNWPRTASGARVESRFMVRTSGSGYGRRHHSVDESRRLLADELERLHARDTVLSTNLRLRIDGNPASNQVQPLDPGAAVYFKLKGRDTVLACDKWKHVECNIYAIAQHIEALRGQARWGVGSIDQAFRGYMQLPGIGETGGLNPHQVLGIAVNADPEQVKEAYRMLARKFHPDTQGTGDREKFERVQNAFELIEAQWKGRFT